MPSSVPLATPKTAELNQKVAVVVGFLVFVEMTSGFLQGYYLPLFGTLAKHLNISDADITWFGTVHTLAAGVCVPILAKLGDIFGHRRILRIAVLLVLAGGLVIALAPTFELVLLGRVIMAPLAVWLPLEVALVHNRIAGERSRKSVGLLVSALTIGVVIGALVSGVVASAVPNLLIVLLVPAVIVASCAAIVFTKVPESTVRTNPKIDYVGFAGLGLFMISLLWGLGSAQSQGFGSPAVVAPLVIAAVVLTAWIFYELRVEVPAVNIRLVASRRLWPVYATSFLFGAIIFGTQTITTTFLAAHPDKVGYGFAMAPGTISLFTAATSLLGAVGAFTFAAIARFIGMRGVLIFATIAGAAGNFIRVIFPDSIPVLIVSVIVTGLATGLLLGALPALIAESSPSDQTGIATGVYNSLKTMGGSAAGAIFGVVLASTALAGTKAASLAGYQTVWIVCVAAFVLCPVALSFIPRPSRTAGAKQKVAVHS